jgi:leucyl aminopeptidase
VAPLSARVTSSAMNGKTIEVINTDAEGRLILADALHWAEKQGATHIVDVATLTGAASVAFGDLISAYFARPREWGSQVAAAAAATGEWFWEMPLATECRDALDSAHADIVNSAAREGSLIKSAVFLSEFVTVPWVHVDIGGSAYLIRDKARVSDAGFYRYLTKPVKVSELTEVLEELLLPRNR